MSYKPQRTFNGTQGNPSTDTMGPEQLSHDIDELCKMFNPNAVHSGGEAGGVSTENMNISGLDINDIGGVASTDIKIIRVKTNGDIEYSTDGTTYHPAFAREDNYLPKAGGTMTGNIAMGSNKVTGLGTPTDSTDASTKAYADGLYDALVTALALKANLASPTFTGTPLAPTADPSTNNTQIATTAFAQNLAATVAGNAYTKDAADAKFETIANADKLVKSITYASGTGTFTIKTQDGTTTTIDTDIEKIPVSVSIIQSGSTYKLRITNEDGSYSECDVSALFNAVSFTDGTTIDFTTTTNSDGSKTVTAEVKDGSITGSKLDPDYKDTLDGLVTQAEAAQGAAEDAEDNAELYAGSASTSATAADGSAKDAEAWAKGTRGGSAVTSGDATYHNNSKYYSEQAATSATGASASATEAQSYAKGSTGSRTGEDTDNSKYYKEQAALSATSASSSASSASSSKLDSEAWAVGQRNGVDVPSTDPTYHNNAKYYKDQAESIVGITVDDALSLTSLNPVQNKVITQALQNVDALPSQTGHSGEFLTTDGTDASWANAPKEMFVVNVTESGGTYTADKTVAEILTALNDGLIPVVITADFKQYIYSKTQSYSGQQITHSVFFERKDEYSSFDEIAVQEYDSSLGYDDYWYHNSFSFMVPGQSYVTAGRKSGTSAGSKSTAEGYNVTASASYSHAEGNGTYAQGVSSHAEGDGTFANASYSHAEGYSAQVGSNAEAGHAEGKGTLVNGSYAHAEGLYTTANHKSQHVFGEYNVADTNASASTARGDYVEIVGKGTADNARSNARTLDWSGNEVLAGKLTVGAGPTNNMDVATKQYVDVAASPELFLVTITADLSTVPISFTADKTYAEISAAITGGKDVQARFGNDRYYYAGNDVETNTSFLFANSTYTTPSSGTYAPTSVMWRVSSSNVWSQITANAQSRITSSGILKGDGSGGVTAATAGTDYQAPLPTQTGQSGKFLTTNGSALSWDTVSALPSQSGQSGKFLTTNGSAASWGTPANTTYTLSISGNRITLTPSSGSSTYVDLPVYNGSVV